MKRVVITGMGTINALGHDVAQTFDGLAHGRCGIGDLTLPNRDRLSVRIGAQVQNWRGEDHFTPAQTGMMDRFSQFALWAARQAIDRSGPVFTAELAEKTGVILGTAGGGLVTADDSYRQVYEAGKNRVHPLVVPRLMHNAAGAHISMAFGLQGPTYCVSSACASSNHAMGQAFHLVRSGLAPVMITGGSESMLCFGGLKAWEGLRVMSKEACRPFSRNRDGMVQGEGAAVFIFEDYDHARRRGAEMLAEVTGFFMNSDAHDLVQPSPAGAARAIKGALNDARLCAGDVGYINAHGTGTAANDKSECAAIMQVFGDHAAKLPVSSTKSMHGHVMGGTGAIELLACIMALRQGIIAPTIGFEEPDPDCALDVVPNEAREAKVKVAISNSFAFGGMNAVLVLQAL